MNVNSAQHQHNQRKKTLQKRVFAYEQNRIESLVHQTNITGRQSVRNLLSLFSPSTPMQDVRGNGHDSSMFLPSLVNPTTPHLN